MKEVMQRQPPKSAVIWSYLKTFLTSLIEIADCSWKALFAFLQQEGKSSVCDTKMRKQSKLFLYIRHAFVFIEHVEILPLQVNS